MFKFVLNFSLLLKNAEVKHFPGQSPTLTLQGLGTNKKFELNVANKEFLSAGQTIATLKEDIYKTPTGGIVCYDIEGNINSKKRRNTKKVFSGSIYWIPEETYVLTTAISDNLKIQVDTIIEPNTEGFNNYTQEFAAKYVRHREKICYKWLRRNECV